MTAKQLMDYIQIECEKSKEKRNVFIMISEGDKAHCIAQGDMNDISAMLVNACRANDQLQIALLVAADILCDEVYNNDVN